MSRKTPTQRALYRADWQRWKTPIVGDMVKINNRIRRVVYVTTFMVRWRAPLREPRKDGTEWLESQCEISSWGAYLGRMVHDSRWGMPLEPLQVMSVALALVEEGQNELADELTFLALHGWKRTLEPPALLLIDRAREFADAPAPRWHS